LEIIFEEKFKNYKKIYLSVSGGVDSGLGLYLIAKHVYENKLNIKLVISTAVEPQPDFGRNDKNAKKIVSIVRDIFPSVNMETHLITFFKGYTREDDSFESRKFIKVQKMKEMHNEHWKNENYDLGISFRSSFPKLKELKQNSLMYEKSKEVGPQNRNWTGKKNDKIVTVNGKNYWQPFLNMTKKDFSLLYEKYDLMYNLFPYTHSCVGNAKNTDNFTKPCKKCFWCLEKYWAFGLFDCYKAYNL
tara:strand:+ start:155 stop:889 length:735 start_codon:yes stop_codon:yes gene_type:complete